MASIDELMTDLQQFAPKPETMSQPMQVATQMQAQGNPMAGLYTAGAYMQDQGTSTRYDALRIAYQQHLTAQMDKVLLNKMAVEQAKIEAKRKEIEYVQGKTDDRLDKSLSVTRNNNENTLGQKEKELEQKRIQDEKDTELKQLDFEAKQKQQEIENKYKEQQLNINQQKANAYEKQGGSLGLLMQQLNTNKAQGTPLN